MYILTLANTFTNSDFSISIQSNTPRMLKSRGPQTLYRLQHVAGNVLPQMSPIVYEDLNNTKKLDFMHVAKLNSLDGFLFVCTINRYISVKG